MALSLIIEDQPLQRRTLAATLRAAGHQVIACGTGRDGRNLCLEHHPETILLDLGLPDADGLDLIPVLLADSPLSRIVVLTGRDSVREAVAALRAGARQYLVKPWDRDELLLILEREIKAVNRAESLQRESHEELFWGGNPRIRSIREDLHKLARSPLTPVFLRGETGTGKEVVAREIHRLSECSGTFVALNCAAVPTELMESELFGHEKGAFTGAETRRRGLVELANDGTLFLDEIGEMAVHLQAKLLRFLQDRTFRRVGAEDEHNSRCRVIAATHNNLESLQAGDRFRSDLYYRLAVVEITLPPLRERREDVLPLAHFLLGRISRRLGRPTRQMSPRTEAVIMNHDWPGNIRELANRIERALVLGTRRQIEPEELDLAPSPDLAPANTNAILRDPHRLRLLLEEEGWNLSEVARRLGVERHKVKYRVKTMGLSRPDKI